MWKWKKLRSSWAEKVELLRSRSDTMKSPIKKKTSSMLVEEKGEESKYIVLEIRWVIVTVKERLKLVRKCCALICFYKLRTSTKWTVQ